MKNSTLKTLAAEYDLDMENCTFDEIYIMQKERELEKNRYDPIITFIAGFTIGAILFSLIPSASAQVTKEDIENSFVPASWNEDRTMIDSSNYKSRIYSGWKNYFDGSDWKEIDLMPKIVGNEIIVNQAPYTFKAPDNADGDFIFENDGLYNKETDSFNSSEKYAKTKKFRNIEPVPAQSVAEGILYKNAFLKYQADLLIKFRPTGVEYLVKLDQEPPELLKNEDVKICFDDKFSGQKDSRKIETLKRIAYDSSPIRKTIELQYDKDNCKIIPNSFLKDVIYPVFADDVDVIISDNGDGYAGLTYGPSNDWNGTVTGNGNEHGTTYLQISGSCDGSCSFPYIRRGLVPFDTSSLPTSSTITATDICLKAKAFPAGNHAVIAIVASGQASNTTTANSDYQAVGSTLYGTGTTVGMSVDQEICITLNASGRAHISDSGFSNFAVREYSHDFLNSTPGSNYYTADFYGSETSGKEPYLEITYTPSGGSTGGTGGAGGSGSGVIVPSFTGSTLVPFFRSVCNATLSGSGICTQWDSYIASEAINGILDSTTIMIGRLMRFLLLFLILLSLLIKSLIWVRKKMWPLTPPNQP